VRNGIIALWTKRMIGIFIIVLLVWALVFAFGLYIHRTPNPPLEKTRVVVGSATFQVELANTVVRRARGLSGREKLENGEGMFFLFGHAGSYGFWMKDMKFPIDIVWIRGNRIAGFAENVKPEPEKSFLGLTVYYPPTAVDRVLEINAGLVEKYKLKAGDTVSLFLGGST